MNKTIKIKCLLCDSLDIYKYHIYMYDSDNNLVDDVETKNGCAYLNVNKYKLYRIIIIAESCLIPKRIDKCIYITDSIDNLFFTFNRYIHKNHSIVIKVIDKYYENLSIMKGEIHLWQKKL